MSDRTWLEQTFRIASDLLESELDGRPLPAPGPEEIQRRLDLDLPREPRPRGDVLELLARVVAMTPRTSSTRFFNQLFAGREPMSGAADAIAALLNSSMYTYKVAGVQVLIERAVTRRMAELAGFAEGDGTWTPGGSLANLVALLLARNEAVPDAREIGQGGRRLGVYVSEEGHYSIRKNAGILGIGRRYVRTVPVDEKGRMLPNELERAMRADRDAGIEPVCVVATAGTTVRGSFDPIREIAERCAEWRVWLHVDGAYGATYLLHPELRALLDGVERADSLAWNAHKMMGAPMPAAVLLVRRGELLHRHLNESADYLFQQDDADLNLGTRSIQCGRRNDALKVWAAWQELGDLGWAKRIEQQLALARHAADIARTDDRFELVSEPCCPTVCFVVRGTSSVAICERLGREGRAVIGYGDLNGRKVIRLVTVNPEVTISDIDRLFRDVIEVARELGATETAPVVVH